MGFRVDITGKKFNSLLVLGFSHNNKYRRSVWTCLCDCGKIKEIIYNSIVNNKTKSCGCLLKSSEKWKGTHGMSRHPLYKRWRSMKSRCDHKSSRGYKWYGERGITYCKEWETFENFYRDMLEGFEDHLELDRIDVNGNYCKENCRWVTASENAYNKNMQSNNKSGKTGVCFVARQNKWKASINKNGKYIVLGHFSNYADAVEVRVLEELEIYGYTRP